MITENFETELLFLEKPNIAIKKQTMSGLFNFKTKFDSKMTGEKKKNNSKNMYLWKTYEKNIRRLYLNKYLGCYQSHIND